MKKHLTIIEHPLIQHNLTRLRDRRTPSAEFRHNLTMIAALMVYEVTRNLATLPAAIQTPLEKFRGKSVAKPIALVPVLRAGLGMLDGILELIPDALVGHIGLARDHKTLQAVNYYANLPPNLAASTVLLIDPMLATGNSSTAAVSLLKQSGARDLRMICLVAAPEGVRRMRTAHPDVPIFTAALDRCLDKRGYILPGLGDAGDRLFGTAA